MYILGSPRAKQLPLHERELLNQVCGTLSTDVVLVYSKLLLTESNRILAACTRQQETLRNNSCLVYTTPSSSNGYGIMEKNLVCESGTTCQAFPVVVPLIPAGVTLCSDTVTNAQLDSRLVTLHSPQQVYRLSMTLFRHACMQERFRPNLYSVVITTGTSKAPL